MSDNDNERPCVQLEGVIGPILSATMCRFGSNLDDGVCGFSLHAADGSVFAVAQFDLDVARRLLKDFGEAIALLERRVN